MTARRPHVLLVGHYPLAVRDRAPVVRIWGMARALASLGSLTVIAGTRGQRARWLAAYARAGKLAGVDAVYVESASSAATPADVGFLALARRRGIPLGIYVRDAYQMFPGLYPPRGLGDRLLGLLYAQTVAAYGRLADRVFFPTAGLAGVFPGLRRWALLPPAGDVLERPPGLAADARRVVYVGAGGPHDGVDLLLSAFGEVRRRFPSAGLTLVMRRREWPRLSEMPGVELCEASGPALDALLWRAGVAVVPRPDTAYNRLALPVKLFDYWAHELPVVVTAVPDSAVATWVRREGAGLVVEPTPAALAEGLLAVIGDGAYRQALAAAAGAAIRHRHNWRRRAEEMLAVLLAGRQAPPSASDDVVCSDRGT